MAKAMTQGHELRHDRTVILSQAFTLWLLDMHSLPPMYTQSQEFRQVYREYYLRFTSDIQRAIMDGHSMGERGRNANGKVTPCPTSLATTEEVGEGVNPLLSTECEYSLGRG